jgi:hypothetical protein
MISIDNSVELMMQTFIQLPKRVTGIDISRARRDEICSGFPKLLDGIEEHAGQPVKALDLGVIEWFHRLRNQLYHQGNGLTVERTKVEAYAELAKALFKCLYGIELDVPETKGTEKFGAFLEKWADVEIALQKLNPDIRPGNVSANVRSLVQEGRLTSDQGREILELHRLRSELVHGVSEPSKILSKDVLEKLARISRQVVSLFQL